MKKVMLSALLTVSTMGSFAHADYKKFEANCDGETHVSLKLATNQEADELIIKTVVDKGTVKIPRTSSYVRPLEQKQVKDYTITDAIVDNSKVIVPVIGGVALGFVGGFVTAGSEYMLVNEESFHLFIVTVLGGAGGYLIGEHWKNTRACDFVKDDANLALIGFTKVK